MDPCSIKIIWFVAIIWGGWNRIQSLNTWALLSHGEYQYTKQGFSKVLVIPEAGAPIKHLAGLQQKDNARENSLNWDKNPSPGSQEQNAHLAPFNILSIRKSKQARKCHHPPQSRAAQQCRLGQVTSLSWESQFLEHHLLPHLSCSRVMLSFGRLEIQGNSHPEGWECLDTRNQSELLLQNFVGYFSPSPFWRKEGKYRSRKRKEDCSN